MSNGEPDPQYTSVMRSHSADYVDLKLSFSILKELRFTRFFGLGKLSYNPYSTLTG